MWSLWHITVPDVDVNHHRTGRPGVVCRSLPQDGDYAWRPCDLV
jgi:hypothetical protein